MQEAAGIHLYPNNFNQDTTSCLWYPAITSMLEEGRAIMKVSERINSDGWLPGKAQVKQHELW